MNKEVIKTAGTVLLIYFLGYLITQVVGGFANILVALYALSLIRTKNLIAIKTVLILLLVFNGGVLLYVLLQPF